MRLPVTSGTLATSTAEWTLYIGIPAAVVAAALILGRLAGLIHPVSVKKAKYWHVDQTTGFSCVVKNNSFFNDRTIDSLAFIRVPGRFKRTFRRFWRRTPELDPYQPFYVSVTLPLTLSKRNEQKVQGEMRTSAGSAALTPDTRTRIEAHAGSKRSRGLKIRLLKTGVAKPVAAAVVPPEAADSHRPVSET